MYSTLSFICGLMLASGFHQKLMYDHGSGPFHNQHLQFVQLTNLTNLEEIRNLTGNVFYAVPASSSHVKHIQPLYASTHLVHAIPQQQVVHYHQYFAPGPVKAYPTFKPFLKFNWPTFRPFTAAPVPEFRIPTFPTLTTPKPVPVKFVRVPMPTLAPIRVWVPPTAAPVRFQEIKMPTLAPLRVWVPPTMSPLTFRDIPMPTMAPLRVPVYPTFRPIKYTQWKWPTYAPLRIPVYPTYAPMRFAEFKFPTLAPFNVPVFSVREDKKPCVQKNSTTDVQDDSLESKDEGSDKLFPLTEFPIIEDGSDSKILPVTETYATTDLNENSTVL